MATFRLAINPDISILRQLFVPGIQILREADDIGNLIRIGVPVTRVKGNSIGLGKVGQRSLNTFAADQPLLIDPHGLYRICLELNVETHRLCAEPLLTSLPYRWLATGVATVITEINSYSAQSLHSRTYQPL